MPPLKYTERAVLLATLALGAAGCVTGPDYARPEVGVAEAWHAQLEGGLQSAPVATAPWWEMFGDPVLTDLMQRAEANNLDLKIAQARVREARAAHGLVNADRQLQLDGTGSYTETQVAGPGTLSSRQRANFSMGFDASWELDIFGGVARATEAADAAYQAEAERLRDVHVSLAAELAINYFDYRTAQVRLDIAKRNIDAQAESAHLTRVRYDAGLSSEFDAVRAEAQLAAFQSQPPLLEMQRDRALHRLGVLMGTEPGELSPQLAETAPLPAPPATITVGLPSSLIGRRPDIRAAERELAAASARIGVAMAERFPRFSLTGALGIQSTGLNTRLLDRESQTWSIGPGVRWPIFDGARIRANIEVQDARHEQALHAYEQSILRALEEVENGLVSFAREQVRYAVLEKALAANERAVDLAKERYAKGFEDFLSVLTAQAQVFDSEDRLLQSQGAILVYLTALYKSLGGI